MSNITLENKQCLIAGDGTLPVKMAQNAKENGFEVVAISFSSDNLKELQKLEELEKQDSKNKIEDDI